MELAVGDERLNGELLADQSFLEDDPVVAGVADVLFTLLGSDLIADDFDALAAGENDRFDREVAVVLVDVVAGCLHVVERLEVRTARNVVLLHELPLEGLVRLDACVGFFRAERVDSRGLECVREADFEGASGPMTAMVASTASA